jgi:hypothetical protein
MSVHRGSERKPNLSCHEAKTERKLIQKINELYHYPKIANHATNICFNVTIYICLFIDMVVFSIDAYF